MEPENNRLHFALRLKPLQDNVLTRDYLYDNFIKRCQDIDSDLIDFIELDCLEE